MLFKDSELARIATELNKIPWVFCIGVVRKRYSCRLRSFVYLCSAMRKDPFKTQACAGPVKCLSVDFCGLAGNDLFVFIRVVMQAALHKLVYLPQLAPVPYDKKLWNFMYTYFILKQRLFFLTSRFLGTLYLLYGLHGARSFPSKRVWVLQSGRCRRSQQLMSSALRCAVPR